MNQLIIGFSKPKSKFAVLSYLIRLVENTPFSHAYVRFTEQRTNRALAFEASGMMVHFTTFEALQRKDIIVEEYSMSISEAQYTDLLNFMFDRLEVKYGVMELVHIGLRKLTGIKITSGDTDKTEICSELAARVCECVGLDVPGNLDYVTPADLQKFISTKMLRIV